MEKILLVYPYFPVTYWGFQHSLAIFNMKSALPPLGLVTLAGELPRNWKCRLVDLNIQKLEDKDLKWADVVFVGGMLIQSESILEVIERSHKVNRPVVVGGPAPTTTPELFSDADILFQGEAEGRVTEIVEAMEQRPFKKQIVLSNEGHDFPSITDVPVPRYDLLDLTKYVSMSIQYTRGCPFRCEFCDVIKIFGQKSRVKTTAQIIAELQELYRLNFRGSIFFVDDNFIGNRKATRHLLPAIAEWQEERNRPFDFYTEASLNLASDDQLIDEMVDAGFRSVFLGIETPSKEILKKSNKNQNCKLDLNQSIDKLTRRGLEIMGGFIVGFDGDTKETIEIQKEFIQSSPIPMAMVGLLMALPGTDLWKRLEKEGRMRGCPSGDQFSRPNFDPIMDEKDLLEGYRDLMAHLYDPKNFYDRVQQNVEKIGPTPGGGDSPLRDYSYFLRGCWELGVKSPHRKLYWKLLGKTLVNTPSKMRNAFVLAAKGEHMILYTKENLIKRINESLEELKTERLRAEKHILEYKSAQSSDQTTEKPRHAA